MNAQDILTATEEGRQAALAGRHFKCDCPYTYNNWTALTYGEFDATKRPLMDAWFAGWKSAYQRQEWEKPIYRKTADS